MGSEMCIRDRSYACTKRNDLPLFSPSPFFKHTQAEDPDPYPGQGLLSSWDRGPAFTSLRGAQRRGNPSPASPQKSMFTKNSCRRHDSAAIIRYSIRVPRKKSRYFSYYSLSFTNTHRQTALTTSPVRAVCRFVVIARERFKAIWKNSLQHGHGQSG